MKIDILIAVAEKGGVENVINMAAPYFMEKRKWDVRVVQLVWEGYTWTADGIPFFPLLYGKNGHTLDEFITSYTGFLTENGMPDMVLAAAWPYMCHVARAALFSLGNCSAKVVSWLHAPVEEYDRAHFGGYPQLQMADMHLAISQYIYEELKNSLPSPSLVMQINNPVDLSACRSGKTDVIRKESTEKKLLFVGRISVEKRLDLIIKALENTNPKWHLWIVGDGSVDLVNTLKQLTASCRIKERVHWLGWQDKPWEYARDADAFVLASEYEGSALVTIEALANGLPVIATPVSGISELIVPGENGYIFPKGDARSLAEILNAMAEEGFPAIRPGVCKDSAAPYEKKIALADFACKLAEMAEHPNELASAQAERVFTIYYQDKISVIVPCYNTAPYIRDCIESLLASTLPLAMLEFIFVDDASTDNTCEIIGEYEAKYPENILLVQCEKNQKQGAARNIGMMYATGNYIAFVDSDDKIRPEMLQILYEKAALYQCDMAGCGYILFTDQGDEKEYVFHEKLYNLADPNERRRYILSCGWRTGVGLRIYRRQFLEENAICFPENIFMEDIYFSELCTMTAARCYEVSEPLYYYRRNPSGTILSVNRDNFLNTFTIQEMAYDAMAERRLLTGFEQELAVLYYEKAFIETIRYMEDGRNGIVWDEEVFRMVRGRLLAHFPDILLNPYLLQDQSDYNKKYLALLKKE